MPVVLAANRQNGTGVWQTPARAGDAYTYPELHETHSSP